MSCKKLDHFLIIFITLFNFILFHPKIAWACSCEFADSVSKKFAEADTVFVGTVRSSDIQRPYQTFPYQIVVFEVKNSWKGARTTYLTVQTGMGSGDCGYPFIPGYQYLVYSHESKGNLYTSICSGTVRIAQATEDLSYLQSLPESELVPVAAPQSLSESELTPAIALQLFCLIFVIASAIVLLGVIWGVWQKHKSHPST